MLDRSYYIPTNSTKVADKNSDAVAYIYTTAEGKPAACVFYGKQAKPIWRYRFANNEQRAKRIAEAFANRAASKASKAKYRADMNQNQLSVGDVLKSTWGYEQTNVDYYEVTRSKGMFVWIRPIRAKHGAEDAFMQGKIVPLPGDYTGDEIRKRAQRDYVKINSYQYASKAQFDLVAGVKVYQPDRISWYA